MSAFRGSVPPKNYVPGLGRGAAGFTTRSDVGPAAAATEGGSGSRAAAARASTLNKNEDKQGQYDDDDNEADLIWAAIDERMNSRRKRKTEEDAEADGRQRARSRIGSQFRQLKKELETVTDDQWANIPDVGDHSLKYKQQRRQQEVFTPLTDSLLEQRSQVNQDATAGNAALAGTTTAANMSGLSAARGTVLGMSLDRAGSTAAAGGESTTVDAEGYLTSLATATTQKAAAADVADISKARLLLQSVRDTNPHHGPGWIAAARVEEAAGKTLQARKILQQACKACPESEDVWLEAARLHPVPVAKSILATAVRRLPTSVALFLRATDLETTPQSKKAVLRKALEANPTSVQLWKAAIELEEADDARVLLSVAVEKIPQAVEMWLALARLETYEQAQKVLNQARKALPTDRSIWIAAAKLEESQQKSPVKVIQRAVQSLQKHEAIISRSQWLQEAQAAESAGAPETAAAIVEATIGLDVEAEDRLRTWSEDAKAVLLAKGSVATARAILAHALKTFPTKRALWMQAVELERQHGDAETLDEVLKAASDRLPNIEFFWLLRAKEQWMTGNVDQAREILTQAFASNPTSPSVWLAASKLERENGEVDRARFFLRNAQERAPTARVYMKSALLEREEREFDAALSLIEEGIKEYPDFAKLYMMGGQICAEDLPAEKSSLMRARKFYERGLSKCVKNSVLWILASKLEEFASKFDPASTSGATKARSLLELSRLKNPSTPVLWLEAIRLERRSGNDTLASALLAKGLQDCPSAGILWAEQIRSVPRVQQKSQASQAIQRCPDDPVVIAAVAELFATDRKYEKARKWLDRAVRLDPDFGDSWARFYAFERSVGSDSQREDVQKRCLQADPKHGELWTCVRKDPAHRTKDLAGCLELVADLVVAQKAEMNGNK